jgi:hypothetical protein
MLIYKLLGDDAQASFARSWGISYGVGAASEWKDIAIEAAKGVLLLAILETLMLSRPVAWLEARPSGWWGCVHVHHAAAAGLPKRASGISRVRIRIRFLHTTGACGLPVLASAPLRAQHGPEPVSADAAAVRLLETCGGLSAGTTRSMHGTRRRPAHSVALRTLRHPASLMWHSGRVSLSERRDDECVRGRQTKRARSPTRGRRGTHADAAVAWCGA